MVVGLCLEVDDGFISILVMSIVVGSLDFVVFSDNVYISSLFDWVVVFGWFVNNDRVIVGGLRIFDVVVKSN